MGLTTWTVDGWTGYLGRPFVPDQFGCVWHVESEKGWRGRPGPRLDRQPRARRRGEWPVRGDLPGRVIELSGRVEGPSHAALAEAVEWFGGVMADEQELYELAVNEDGLLRYVYVRPADAIEADLLTPYLATWSVLLWAPDPAKYGELVSLSTGLPAASVGLIVPAGGLVVPAGGLVVSAGGTSGTLLAPNPGRTYTYPLLEIDGEVDTPRIEHPTSGRVLEFDLQVPAFQTLLIDPDNATVTLDGQNRYGALTTASSPLQDFRLDPGQNELAFRATAAAGLPQLRVRYRPAVLG